MIQYYFIDDEIYYQGKKQPDRVVALYAVTFKDNEVFGYDEDGNLYILPKERVFQKICNNKY